MAGGLAVVPDKLGSVEPVGTAEEPPQAAAAGQAELETVCRQCPELFALDTHR